MINVTLPARCRLSPVAVIPMPDSRADDAASFFRIANEATRQAIYWRRRPHGLRLARQLMEEARLFRFMARTLINGDDDGRNA